MIRHGPISELISYGLCPYVQRGIIILTEKGVEHRRTYIDAADNPDWYLQMSRLPKLPAMQTGGTTSFERAVICEFIDEATPGNLHPADPVRRAKQRSWIVFGSPILNAIALLCLAKTPAEFEANRQALQAKIAWVEGLLGERPFFDGSRFGPIDAVYATIFRYFDVIVPTCEFGIFDDLKKVQSCRRTVMVRPSVANTVVPSYYDGLHAFFHRRDSHVVRVTRTGMEA